MFIKLWKQTSNMYKYIFKKSKYIKTKWRKPHCGGQRRTCSKSVHDTNYDAADGGASYSWTSREYDVCWTCPRICTPSGRGKHGRWAWVMFYVIISLFNINKIEWIKESTNGGGSGRHRFQRRLGGTLSIF